MEALVFNSSMFILVNGSPTKYFVVSIGLWLGDSLSRMMRKVLSLSEFVGYKANEDLHFDILQFSNDTLSIGGDSWNTLWSVKAILKGFKVVTGLRVNLSKSHLLGVNLVPNFVQEASYFLNCFMGSNYFISRNTGGD